MKRLGVVQWAHGLGRTQVNAYVWLTLVTALARTPKFIHTISIHVWFHIHYA